MNEASKSQPLMFSADWGTSRLRLRLVAVSTGEVLGLESSDRGVAELARSAATAAERAALFEAELTRHRRSLLLRAGLPDNTVAPCVLSGMAGSSLGWIEVPYALTPFPLDGSRCAARRVELRTEADFGPVWIVGGVRTETDVMRGEECEALGIMQDDSVRSCANQGVLLLPGTHTKHIFMRDGMIRDFSTFMTGELFEMLRLHGLLVHSVLQQPPPGLEQRPAFAAGVRAGANTPLLSALFTVRVEQLLRNQTLADGTAWLCGLLVGAECAALRDGAGPFLVAAVPKVAANYTSAADILGIRLRTVPPDVIDSAVARAHLQLLSKLT